VNLQRIKQVVVCAALVALLIAGAELFSTQPVAGQETKRQTLRGEAALDQLKQDGQYESLQAAMRQAHFSVSRAEATPLGRAAWHAPNAAAGYDAYVTEEGVSVAVSDQSYVSLSLQGVGYGEALQAVGPGEVNGERQTINITRAGGLREWYVNGPDGLEHGFTLNEPPGARSQGSPLRLALQVGAGWRAVASDDGKWVTLRGPRDEAVEYGKLVVRDKLGRNISARLTVIDEQVVIEVEDHDAEYPLTIDPIFTLPRKLTATDGAANDYLGYSVALDGDTALVGAPYDDVTGMEQGSVYVFVRNGATWTQQARLTAQDGASFDYFGWSVALKGNLALVGAIYGPGPANPDQGAVYVFERGGTTWFQQARLNANENTVGAQFGAAVALNGQTALIGAPTYTSTPSYAITGAAYVFTRSGVAWTQQARLNANDGEDGDHFGVAVALDGDTALIGAPNNAVTAGGQGAAYVFARNGASWTQRQRLTASNGAVDDHFGNAVALSGEKALIGAYLYGSDDRGALYTFRRGATNWTQTDQTLAPNPTAGARFGVSVALDGNTAVIGASLGLFQTGVDQRSAYVFVYGGEWFLVRRLGPELGSANDRFGYAVALDGDTVLAGAYRGDAAANDQGAAYAFTLRDSRSVEQQKLTAQDGATNDRFGSAVALDGDTLVVGAWGDTIGANVNQGSVYIFTRNGATWTQQQKLTSNDGAADDSFGYSVALDGAMLVVGAYRDTIGGNANQGSAYIFTRNGTVWAQQQKLTAVAIDGLPNDNFGRSVALGSGAVVVGASGADTSRGSVYVFTFNGAVWTQQAKLTANDRAAGDEFGYAVGLSGDTLVVGAFRDSIGANTQQGSAYVFTRNSGVWTQQQKITANDGGVYGHFGYAVALDADTLAVGAPGNSLEAPQGAAYVFARAGAAWVQAQKLAASDGVTGNSYGSAVAMSGGILVVGALGDGVGAGASRGSAYVYTLLGNWQPQTKLTASDGAAYDYFGWAVALDADTMVIGASGDDIGANDYQGSAYVFVSPACPTITIAPASLLNGALSASYNQNLTASDGSGVGDYQFAVSSGALPPGLTLDPPGLLHGAPTATGTYRFTITATYFLSLCSGSREYTITITAPPSTITINPATLPNGAMGAAYSQTLAATGGKAPYRYSVTAGATPRGLSLSADGVLSGTPAATGAFDFTVTATDANGSTGAKAYTLVVNGCGYTITPASQSFSASAATGAVMVAAGAGCAWTATSNAPWLTITGGANGTGAGQIDYRVAANTGAAQQAVVTVAGQRHLVQQAAAARRPPRLTRLSERGERNVEMRRNDEAANPRFQ